MDSLIRQVPMVFFLYLILSAESVCAEYDLSGSWHGMFLDKPIELAIWKNKKPMNAKWSEFYMYVYSSEYDCWLVGNVGYKYKSDETHIIFTSLGTSGTSGSNENCQMNIPTDNKGFKGRGTIDLTSLPEKLVATFQSLEYPGSSGIKEPKLSLKKGPISDRMFKLVTKYKHANIVKPDSTQLALLKPPQSQTKDRRQKGIVHKNESYFNIFGDNSVVEEVFNGEFNDLDSNTIYKVYYTSFLAAYSDVCRDHLLPDAVQRGFATQTVHTDGNGNEQWREKPVVRDIFIEQNYLKKYDEYLSDTKFYTAMQKISSAFSIRAKIEMNAKRKGIIKSTTDAVKSALSADPTWQMIQFNKKAGCGSATMAQMRENLWRSSQHMVSVQKDNVQIENAAYESVPLKDALPKRAFFNSCIEHLNKNDRSSINYCTCLDSGAKQIMTEKEYDYYSKDFYQYYLDKSDNLYEHPASSHIWALNEIHSNCTH